MRAPPHHDESEAGKRNTAYVVLLADLTRTTSHSKEMYKFAFRNTKQMIASTINLESEDGKDPGGGSRGRPGE